ncbi:MAG: uracil-DNA glycosylase [Candidatus Synoicihabitans palmerolidicus]|nr:uracil-DNA glycosylase [Candidatus Synoicihabitans palmerolidicus]
MRATLHALTEELRRLKTAGVTSVSVSPESMEQLRTLVRARAAAMPAGEPERQPQSSARKGGDRTGPSWEPKVVAPPAPQTPVATLPLPPTVKLPEGDKQMQWDARQTTVLRDPVCLENISANKKVMIGVGNLDATIFFCGEAPGAEEETQGEPFVGPAGQLLTKMIGAMGLKRSEVYIGNIMNWRPKMPTIDGREQIGNRPPTAEELSYCLPYLRAQLEVVKPDVIVALGATAARGLLGADSFKTLGEIRGKWHAFGDHPVMVTYHPSYILQTQSNRSKRVIWEDLLQVMIRTGLPISDKQQGFFKAR